MSNDKIIQNALLLGFKLDYDKSDGASSNGIKGNLKYMRFVSIDASLDEKDLRWIWRMDDSDEDNLKEGNYIKSRLAKKKNIQNFLKY
jgi:hypothetical protein|tara:strand:+ start:192 stop:455 length:264 start_codon:yes stop_codon:yes gene_type:complete